MQTVSKFACTLWLGRRGGSQKTILALGGRCPGPPPSQPASGVWAGGIRLTGCHFARFLFSELTSAAVSTCATGWQSGIALFGSQARAVASLAQRCWGLAYDYFTSIGSVKKKARREVGLAPYGLGVCMHFEAQGPRRITKSTVVSVGRSPGPPPSHFPRGALGSLYPLEGVQSRVVSFQADVVGDSVNLREGLDAPPQRWRGLGDSPERRCPSLTATGSRHAIFLL